MRQSSVCIFIRKIIFADLIIMIIFIFIYIFIYASFHYSEDASAQYILIGRLLLE